MATLFVDIDSTFRNRNSDSNPGYFTIPIATASTTTVVNDPICLSMPLISWTSLRFTVGAFNNSVTGIIVLDKSHDTIIYIVGNLQNKKNYYRNAPIQFDGLIQRRIISYTFISSGLGRFEIDTPVDNFSAGLNVTIFDPTNLFNPAGLELFVPGGNPLDDSYTNLYIYNENHKDFRVISRYIAANSIIETNSPNNPATTWGQFDNYSIRNQLPALESPASGSTTQVVITNGNQIPASLISTSFIRQLQLVYGNEQDLNGSFASQIVSWNPITLTATVSPPFPQPVTGIIEILPISSDNATSFVNIHSQVGGLIKFSLLHLSLPKTSLATKFGGNVEAYPYIYLSLSNVSSSMPKFNFVSNNPNATSIQFRATLSPNNNSSYFYKLTGDQTVQSLQINPNDSLVMAIYLPDGSLWKTLDNDTTSPSQPNPLLQISAYFSYETLGVKKNLDIDKGSSFVRVAEMI